MSSKSRAALTLISQVALSTLGQEKAVRQGALGSELKKLLLDIALIDQVAQFDPSLRTREDSPFEFLVDLIKPFFDHAFSRYRETVCEVALVQLDLKFEAARLLIASQGRA